MSLRSFLYVLFGFTVSSYAHAFTTFHSPQGFESFLFDTIKPIKMNVVGGQYEATISALVSYDSLKIKVTGELRQVVTEFLQKELLNQAAIEMVLNELSQGIHSDEQCQKSLSDCLVKPLSGQVHYVFDYDHDELRLFVSSNLLDAASQELEYLPSFNSSNALVNSSNLTVNSDLSENARFTLANKTVLGLPYGFFDFDTQYRSYNEDFTAYKYFYNVEHDGYQFRVGGSERGLSFNSTDFMNKRHSNESIGMYFASNRNLIKGNSADLQRIYFYAPSNGVLEVFSGDELILNKTVNEGRQYISYAELPSGAYQIRLVLSVGGFEVMNEVQQVVNTQQFDLPVGEFDYLLSSERLSQRYGIKNEVDVISGAITYRATEAFIFAAGAMYSGYESGYQTGIDYYWRDKLNVNYTINGFDSSAFHQSARLSFNPFFVDYRHYSQGSQNVSHDQLIRRLSVAMYGYQEYTDVGIGLSGWLAGGSAYFRYSYFDRGINDMPNDYTNPNLVDGNHSISSTSNLNRLSYDNSTNTILTMGWASQAFGGRLNLNANSTFYQHKRDNLSLSISWSKQLGSRVRVSSNTSIESNGVSRNVNNIGLDTQLSDWHSNLAAGISMHADYDYSSELSGTISGGNDAVNAYLYGYYGQGNQHVSGSISNTQIVTPQSVSFTSQPSQSYLLLDKQIEQVDGSNSDPDLYMGITLDGQYRRSYEVSNNDESIIPLQNYHLVGLHADSLGARFDVSNSVNEVVSLPGSVHRVSTTVRELEEVLVVFDDIFGSPIDSLRCIGVGCRVERVSNDGVFRVVYQSGIEVRLVSQSGVCLGENDTSSSLIYGRCLPGISDEFIEQEDIFIPVDLTYIGAYLPSDELTEFIDGARHQNANLIHVELSGVVHLYLDLRADMSYGAILEQDKLMEGLLSFRPQLVNDYLTKG